MIELQDAIERAKLAADSGSMLASYTYDRIVEQLDQADIHAFTMALVDLGIHAKYGSLDDESHMAHVLAMGNEDTAESTSDNRRVSIVEEFVKAAQQFVQSPGGLWTPDTWQAEEEAPVAPEGYGSDQFAFDEGEEDNLDIPMDEDFQDYQIAGLPEEDVNIGLDEDPNIGKEFEGGLDPATKDDPIYEVSDSDIVDESPAGEVKEEDNTPLSKEEKVEAAQVREVLDSGGIQVEDGMVTFHTQNDRGRFLEQGAMRPLSVDAAANLYKNKIKGLESEKTRVAELQDVLSVLNGEFDDIGDQLDGLAGKFNDSFDNLEKFRYSAQNGDETVQQIGEGLNNVREYLTTTDPHVKEMWQEFKAQSEVTDALQGNLDEYFQRQYDGLDEVSALADALETLKGSQGTKMYDEIVGDQMSNVTAKFKKVMFKLEGQMSLNDMLPDDRQDMPEYGSLTVEIGIDWLRNAFEEMAPGESDKILQAFLADGGYENPSALAGLIDVWKRDYGVGVPPGSSEDVEVRIEQVPSPSDEVGLELGVWDKEPMDPDGRESGGFVIGDIQYVQDTQKIQQDLKEDLSSIVQMHQEGVY